MIDREKRKRVMQRSIKLGHCICNPRQDCPCPTFKESDLCPCAGERRENALEDVKLTRLVEKAGCASKINRSDLKKVLSGLPELSDPNVLVGVNTCDDAGVYKLDDHCALVQTVDVFTPCVDDPYTFGQIAAANSLSDVYAMGGRPITALSVIGFPIETLSHRIMTQMLRGGMDKMREAGVAIIGGHSINDKDLKLGYAVTGVVDPSHIVTNAGARPGDVLILTKPLGVGIISFAAQMGKASDSALAAASRSMAQLNRVAAEVMVEFAAICATDVTGFGLLGHLGEMVAQSGVSAEIYFDRIPVFDEVMDLISRGFISGGIERNREESSGIVDADDVATCVLCDPQTSGGLLMAVAQERSEALVAELRRRGASSASVIGRITGESDGRIIISRSSGGLGSRISADVKLEVTTMSKTDGGSCCCSGGPESVDSLPGLGAGDGSKSSQQSFSAFMSATGADGAIGSRAKELMAVALSVLSKCEPCVKIHIKEARSMGISEEEISEAVWMAISFGGAPTMMFYRSVMEKTE